MTDVNQGAQAVQPTVVQDKASGTAIAALVLGILSFCCCGFLAGIPALVLGYIENGKISRGQASQKGKWMAVAGMVLGIISLLLSCIQIIWIFFFGGLSILQNLGH